MEQIKVTRNNGSSYFLEDRSLFREITSAKQNIELRNNDTISVEVKSRDMFIFNIGDKFTFQERIYTLNQTPRVGKNASNDFTFSLVFEGVQFDLRRASYDVNIDTTGSAVYGETLTANLELFLNVMIQNVNRVFPGKWQLGEFPKETETRTLTFSEEENCLNVLQQLCEEYDIDFTIKQIGGKLVLNMLQVGEEFDFTFQVGSMKGLYNLSREKVNSSDITTRMKIYGAAKNLGTDYRSNRLVLKGKNKTNSYLENAQAIAKYGIYEGVKIFEDIFPKRTGTITQLSGSIYKFKDSTMDFDLNERKENGADTKYLLNGVSAKIHFNTGMLAGYEFEIHKYDATAKEFHVKKFADSNDYEFPSKDSDAFRFAIGDEYVLLDIMMPESYIDAAEQKLFDKGLEALNDQLDPLVQYNLNVDALCLFRMLGNDDRVIFNAGDFIRIKDDDMIIDRSIRIKSIERDLKTPFIYQLTISDAKVTTSFQNNVISDINAITNIIKLNNLNDPARAKRNWKDSQEVLDMVFDPEGDYYTEKIKPNSIETMHLQVGAKSMQFNLIDSFFEPNLNGNPNAIKWKACKLQHFTIDVDKIRDWNISGSQINLLANKAYYIFAKCNKANNFAAIEITELQRKTDEGDHYYFLIGILNSYDDAVKAREISLMYGFTTVSGRFIRTGRIQSSGGGGTYFDLDTGEIYGKITFTNDSPGIKQVADSIKIGGVNLFEKSTFKALPSIGEKTHMPILVDKTPDGIDLQKNTKGLQLVTSGAANKDVYFLLDQNINIAPGEYYTLSFDLANAIGSGLMKSNCFIYFDNGVKLPLHDADFNGFHIPTTRSIAFKTAVGSKSLKIRLGFSSTSTSTAWVVFSKIMLEKGNKPTAWQPSPNDGIEEIDSFSLEMKKVAEVTSFLNTTIDGNVVATGLLIVGSGNQSNAGISGLNEAGSNSVRLWAGGTAQNRSKAKWMICDNGVERTYHPNGNLATVKGIIDGVFVYDFYHENGAKLFELSPNRGLVNVAYIPESYISKKFFDVNQSGANLNQGSATAAIKANLSFRYYEEQNSSGQIEVIKVTSLQENFYCLQYDCGTKPDNLQFEKNNGYKASQSRYDNVKDGWFGFAVGEIDYQSPSNNPNFSFDYILYFIQGGKVMKNQKIIIPN